MAGSELVVFLFDGLPGRYDSDAFVQFSELESRFSHLGLEPTRVALPKDAMAGLADGSLFEYAKNQTRVRLNQTPASSEWIVVAYSGGGAGFYAAIEQFGAELAPRTAYAAVLAAPFQCLAGHIFLEHPKTGRPRQPPRDVHMNAIPPDVIAECLQSRLDVFLAEDDKTIVRGDSSFSPGLQAEHGVHQEVVAGRHLTIGSNLAMLDRIEARVRRLLNPTE